MKKPVFRLFTLVVLFGVYGCVNSKYTSKDYDKSGKKNVGVLRPISIIALIEEKNQAKYDSVLSAQTASQLLSSTIEMVGNDKNCKEINLDNVTQKKVYDEILEIGSKIHQAKGKTQKELVASSYKMPDTIYNILNDNNLDQLVISYHRGFTRTKANYRNQNLKNLGVGLLTLGMYIPIAIKSNSLLYTWVLDKSNRSIVFSNKSLEEIEPVDFAQFSQQICGLYLNFYTANTPNGPCYHQ